MSSCPLYPGVGEVALCYVALVPHVHVHVHHDFIEILQQFQTNSVRHQAHSDENVENGGQSI